MAAHSTQHMVDGSSRTFIHLIRWFNVVFNSISMSQIRFESGQCLCRCRRRRRHRLALIELNQLRVWVAVFNDFAAEWNRLKWISLEIFEMQWGTACRQCTIAIVIRTLLSVSPISKMMTIIIIITTINGRRGERRRGRRRKGRGREKGGGGVGGRWGWPGGSIYDIIYIYFL